MDNLIVFNDQDHKKIDRGKEMHVLAGVRLLGTVRIKDSYQYMVNISVK